MPYSKTAHLVSEEKHILTSLCKWFAFLGTLSLMLMMLMTISDILLRTFFNKPIVGSIDLTLLFMSNAVFFTFPYTFITNSHVEIELFTQKASKKNIAILQLSGQLLATVTMFFIGCFMFKQALKDHFNGAVSETLAIPLIWYWLPFIIGSLLSVIVCLFLAMASLTQLSRKWDQS